MTAADDGVRVRWYNRLAFRLAVLLGVLLLVFEFIVAPLYDRLVQYLGLPTPGEVYVFDPLADGAGTPIDELLDQLADAMLLGATDPQTGRTEPTAESRALVERMMVGGEGYVWLDQDYRVQHKSTWLPWPRGSAWPHGIESHTDIDLGEDGRRAHVIYAPKQRDQRHVGTLVMVSVHDDADGHVCESDFDPNTFSGWIVTDDEQLQRSLARKSLVSSALTIGLAIGVTMVLLWGLSRFVTRRLSRLAEQAAQPLGADGGLPAPFEVGGRDEITVLAGAMNAMRGRVAALLGGLAQREVNRREWIAQVSHDLRTPLTALTACLDRAEMLLAERDDDASRERLRELIQVAQYDADRVRDLADDLLEIARLEAEDDLLREPVPPGELVRQAVRGLGPLAEARGVRLETVIESVPETVEADGRRLLRALENLLRNAIQHARSRVEVRVAQAAGGLRFAVGDDGPGLPESDGRIDLVALSERRSRDDSTGLGLRVTRRVAEAHGGRIGAENSPESGGALVWFEIPLGA